MVSDSENMSWYKGWNKEVKEGKNYTYNLKNSHLISPKKNISFKIMVFVFEDS
jgi:hypothetical protein